MFRLCLWLNFIAVIQVTAGSPNSISYRDVMLRAYTSSVVHHNNLAMHKELFHTLFMSDLLPELRDSIRDIPLPAKDAWQRNAIADETPQEAMPDVLPTQVCLNDTNLILSQAMVGEKWATRMLDAAAKPGSNIEGGQVIWVGSYMECIGTTATDNTTGKYLFDGQYCSVVIPTSPGPIQPVILGAATSGIRIGLCFPNTCHKEDITVILNRLLEQQNVTAARVGATICQEKLNFDSKAITVLCVIVLFISVILIGTVYDVVWKQMPKWKQAARKVADDNKPQNRTVNIKDHSHSQSMEKSPLMPKTQNRIEEEEEGVVGETILAFSVYRNTAKIFTVRHAPGSITSIHGIRFISMTWVILGHTIAFGQSAAQNVASYTQRALKDWKFQVIVHADVSVDTFFAISGLLVSYLILKELSKNRGRINWLMFYFHRYWRLTPVYMMVIVVYVNLFRYWGEGPLWPQDGIEPDHCKNWWTNLLYINNLVNVKDQCMSWSWYLANDMQFYIVSPLIFIPFYYSRVAGTVSALLFLLATSITSGVLTKQREFPPSMVGGDITKVFDFFLDYYIKPYCRIGPYIIGMVTGYLLYKNNCKLTLPKIVNLLGWTTATAVSLAVLYGLYDNTNGDPLTVDQSALFNAVNRTAWGACVCWVVFACATGNGGFINSLLSWPAIIPLSRLTYTCYLIHPVVMSVYYFGREQLFVLSTIDIMWTFFGHLTATYLIALPTSLAFEAPMMGLERAFLKRPKSS